MERGRQFNPEESKSEHESAIMDDLYQLDDEVARIDRLLMEHEVQAGTLSGVSGELLNLSRRYRTLCLRAAGINDETWNEFWRGRSGGVN